MLIPGRFRDVWGDLVTLTEGLTSAPTLTNPTIGTERCGAEPFNTTEVERGRSLGAFMRAIKMAVVPSEPPQST